MVKVVHRALVTGPSADAVRVVEECNAYPSFHHTCIKEEDIEMSFSGYSVSNQLLFHGPVVRELNAFN